MNLHLLVSLDNVIVATRRYLLREDADSRAMAVAATQDALITLGHYVSECGTFQRLLFRGLKFDFPGDYFDYFDSLIEKMNCWGTRVHEQPECCRNIIDGVVDFVTTALPVCQELSAKAVQAMPSASSATEFPFVQAIRYATGRHELCSVPPPPSSPPLN
jgi:hypothetical protein